MDKDSLLASFVRLLLGIPALILANAIEDPWRDFLLPLLPRSLSKDAVDTLFDVSLLATMLAAWMTTLKIADLIFGTSFLQYGTNRGAISREERARLHRRGLLILLGIVTADQLLNLAFGTAHPVIASDGSDMAPDAMLIVDSLGILLFAFAWWRSRDSLESLALSLVVSGGASIVLDQIMRNRVAQIPIHALGSQEIISFAPIVGIIGMGLLVVSWFWEPNENAASDET